MHGIPSKDSLDRKLTLVTGSNGFIGHAVCNQALRSGIPIRATVRNHHSKSDYPDALVVGDLSGSTDWSQALHNVDVVIHLAARAHELSTNEEQARVEYRRVNTDGTLSLGRQSAAAGVRRFVYLSSIGVNGNLTEDAPFNEMSVPYPHDLYSRSKLEAEEGLLAIAEETGLEVVIIRPPLVYGPRAKGSFASLVKWIHRGIPLPLGSVQNQRSLVALDNLVDFILLCSDPERSPRAANEIFLLSDGEDVSTSQLLSKVALAYGVSPRLLPVPAKFIELVARLLGQGALAERLLGSLVVDSSKARELLEWTPKVSMDDQLREMALYDPYV